MCKEGKAFILKESKEMEIGKAGKFSWWQISALSDSYFSTKVFIFLVIKGQTMVEPH